ncbi:MAG: nicotinate-nucleotide--dimethylbenzimidazole phosphoribosyltransferase [Pseudomonadota bacterium]
MTERDEGMLREREIAPPPAGLEGALAERLGQKTMPPGALGRLGALAIALGVAQGRATPAAAPAEALIFAADHGLVAEGVSAWPQDVTALMVERLVLGDAAAPVLARAAGAQTTVVDVGVAGAYRVPLPALIDAKRRPGSRNAAIEDALTPAEVRAALEAGAAAADAALARGAVILVPGEMGIGNTATAALLAHAATGIELAVLAGPGAGLDAPGVARKLAVLERVAARRPGALEPEEALAAFGGLEIAAMAGAMIAGGAGRAAVVVDGFIATTAALLALAARPELRPSLVFAHRSAEPGHQRLLEHLGVEPLLDLGLRLGEGTGGILALPLLQAAAAIMAEMATFESAGIAGP